MSDISTEILITNILNSMTKSLDDDQLRELKNTLYIHLHDINVSHKCYDLVEVMRDNDTIKMNYLEASMRVARYSDKTIKQYLSVLKNLRNFVGKNISDITSVDIKYFLAYHQKEKKWMDSTTDNYIHYYSSVFNLLMKDEMIEKNPMDKISSIHCEVVKKKPFTSVEMEQLRMVARTSARNIALIEFLYATGIRVGELTKLRWNDIDFQHLSLIVYGKGKKQREVLFSEKAGFYLLRYLDERMTKEKRTKEEIMNRPLFVCSRKNSKTKDYEALSIRSIEDLITLLGTKAQVEESYPHKFRRTFATDAINHGMPLEQVKELMGHSQYDTTLIYAQIKINKIEQSYRTYCE